MTANITISLNIFERKFLLELANRSGRMNLDFTKITQDAQKAVLSLEDKGTILIIDIVGHSEKELVLTDIGRNLCTMIEKKEIIT